MVRLRIAVCRNTSGNGLGKSLRRKSQLVCDTLGERFMNFQKHVDHPLANRDDLYFTEFESKSVLHVAFFVIGETLIEELGLAKMVKETLASSADLLGIDALFEGMEAPLGHLGLERAAVTNGIGVVRRFSFVNLHAVHPVALVVCDLRDGFV